MSDIKTSKKNIGIVTINDLNNYGNRLQNYATVQYLEKLGFEVNTLIISQRNIKTTIRKIAELLKLKKKIAKHWSEEYKNRLSKNQLERYELFKDFSYRYCNIKQISYWKGFHKKINKECDYFITGSDQVWNPLIGRGKDWEFLDFSDKEKNISWSASFGISEIPDKYKKKFKKYIMNIDNVSVREEAGVDIVNKLTGKKAELLIDPTMMISSDEWRSCAKAPNIEIPDRYILSFFLGEKDEKRKEQLNKLAQKNNCEIIDLLDKDCEVLYKTGPEEFIYLIENATLVCTDSFHASVFSILLDRPFYVFGRQGSGNNMNSRITTLLSKFNLMDRLFVQDAVNKENLSHNYDEAYEVLEVERKRTKEFLSNILI